MLKFFDNIPEEKLIRYFKWVCIIEGITCFLLFIVAMPLKYEFGIWWQMIPAGSLHGLFFTLYMIMCIPMKKILHWDEEDFIFALLAGFFPFGSIWVEKKLVK